ncbi:MAG: Calx-beta domain-containing protein, partial [Planctomycetia bacterium]
IWARVVEDFSPFDVDVTTEEPALEDLRKLGEGDARWGIRVVIGIDSGDVAPSAGGVAYLTSFNWNSDTPCFVFPERLGNSNKNIAEATSHEVGHTLGLNHDGRISPSEGYYYGHGSGATGWAPIMGVGYSKSVVQWSKGEYTSANNTEDDLKIITTNNGFGYRADDYGSTTATAFVPSGLGLTPTVIAGVVEQNTDVDVFRFSTLNTIKATILPDSISPNLDVSAEIWNSSGQVIFTSNPASTLDASFDLTVSPGEYYLAIRGAGLGDPLGTGYTNYASLGQYSLSLAVNPDTGTTVAIAAADASKSEGDSGTTSFTFTVTRSGTTTGTTSLNWAVAGSGTNPAAASDFVGGTLPSGLLSFAAGETSKTITVNVAGDLAIESDETFTVTLSSATGGSIATASAVGTILNDDTEPTLAIAATSAVRAEGNSGSTPFTFTVTRTGSTLGATSANWAVTGGSPNPATAADFVGGTLPGGTVSFAAGETTKTITVNVAGDVDVESDELFTVTLSGVTGGVIGTASADGAILNDDAFVEPSLVISSASSSKAEGNAGTTPFTFTVTRSGSTLGTTSVNWSVAGAGTDPASADDFQDGVMPYGTLVFA